MFYFFDEGGVRIIMDSPQGTLAGNLENLCALSIRRDKISKEILSQCALWFRSMHPANCCLQANHHQPGLTLFFLLFFPFLFIYGRHDINCGSGQKAGSQVQEP